MAAHKILIIDGHPDPDPARFNILKFVGIRPVERTLIGLAGADEKRRQAWLEEMEALGTAGE